MRTKKKSGLTNVSSKQIDAQLHRVSFRDIKILGDILSGLSLKKEEFVRKRFSETGVHYSDVAGFLKNLGLLHVAKGQAGVAGDFVGACEDLQDLVVRHLLEHDTSFSPHLYDFLNHFRSTDGRWEIVMDSEKRRRFGGIRNLLLDLEFLDHDFDGVRYWIAAQHLPAFLESRSTSCTSPVELRQIMSLREQLGRDAEIEVLRYEAARLQRRPDLARRIRHIALEDVGAGFDISSFTLSTNRVRFRSRLIEVKAVSPHESKFFWSRHEIETARVNGSDYFLYLVPASKNGFEIQKLRIVENPFEQVYLKHRLWLRQEELVSFWPAPSP
jgi:hypothetical protein